MKHPTDDMLLAYVRRQQRDLWPVGIQEHIADCSLCSERCTEFELIGSTLETWAHASGEDPLYATVSKRVMRTISPSKITRSERVRRGISQVHVALPVAAVIVVLFVLCIGLGANIVVNVAKSQLSEPGQLVVSPQPTVASPIPIVPFGPIPTVAVRPTVTEPVVTATPHNKASIVLNASCTTDHLAQNQLRVCGKNFTPHTTVAIDYHTAIGKKTHIVQVTADGTFIDVVSIEDCKNVPGSIYAQSTTKQFEKAQITQSITIGKCQGIRNSQQNQ